MTLERRTPVCLALVLCDQIFPINSGDGFIFVNVFHVLRAPAFPFIYPQIAVYSTMTEGMGRYDVRLSIESAETGREVTRTAGVIEFKQPLGMNDTVMVLRNLVFPQPGKYWAVLYAGEQLLVQRPFYVETRRPRPAPAAQSPGGPPPPPP